jgi:hypothetical protein
MTAVDPLRDLPDVVAALPPSRQEPAGAKGGSRSPVAAPVRQAYHGAVVSTLASFVIVLERMTTWLTGRSWTSSTTTAKQREQVERVYQQVSNLQQNLIHIRTTWPTPTA